MMAMSHRTLCAYIIISAVATHIFDVVVKVAAADDVEGGADGVNNETVVTQKISLPGAGGSGPYEAVKDWISAFESKYPEADFTISSVGSGAGQAALWGDVNCVKKPIEKLCDEAATSDVEDDETPTRTVWGIGGGTFDEESYVDHKDLALQQLPALGGPILVTYSKDVTGNLGKSTDASLNLTFDVISGLFNGTIVSWDHPLIMKANPNLQFNYEDSPPERITVVVRADKSGMSQTFTQAIAYNNPTTWPQDAVGKTPDWPLVNLTHSSSTSAATCNADNATARHFKADGQTGIGISQLRRSFSVAYLELGYWRTISNFVDQAHVSSSTNPDLFVPATVETLKTTMGGLVDLLEPETLEITLVEEPIPKNGYPISRYVYWYVKKNYTEYESCYQAWLLYKFIEWTYTDPQAEEIALDHGWVATPPSVVNAAMSKLEGVQCYDNDPDDDKSTDTIIYVKDYTPPPHRDVVYEADDDNLKILLPAILVPLLVLACVAVYVYIERKKKSGDSIWSVKPSELIFDDPVVVVGRGTFGLVVLAEYRGTQVAVKRVIPPRVTYDQKNNKNGASSSDEMRRRSVLGTGDVTEDHERYSQSSVPIIELNDKDAVETSSEEEENQEQHDGSLSGDGNRPQRRLSGGSCSGSTGRKAQRRLSNHLDFGEDASHSKAQRRLSGGSCSGSTGDKAQRWLSDNLEFGDDAAAVRSNFTASRESRLKASGMSSGISFASSVSMSTQRKSSKARAKSKRVSYIGRLRGQRDEYAKLKEDFIIEMRYLSKLRHPCITTVMGAVIAKHEEPMLVMEYMEHGSLYDMLHNETVPLDGDLLLPILRDVAQGLRFLHASDPEIIHGDLKAANVLVDSKFRAKVADFGLSCKKGIGATGTPLWMAPELLRRESENTDMSDVYSFGIILYEVYSRKDPYYDEKDLKQVLKDVANPKVSKRPPVPQACPKNVADIMKECLVDDPHSRPTFEELDLRLKRLTVDSVDPGEMHLSLQKRKDLKAGRAESLLYDIFPRHIADALRDGRKVDPEHHESVAIFFSDIVGFTTISETISSEKVANMLDRLYEKFDALSQKHDVFKIETIGDAYMAITNLVKEQKEDYVKRIAAFSIDALKAASETEIDVDDPNKGCVEIRVGFHTGPCTSDVVGTRKLKYSVFGDAINTASRMESNSLPGCIQCSKDSGDILKKQAPDFPVVPRGSIRVKGKGEMHTYWVGATAIDEESGLPVMSDSKRNGSDGSDQTNREHTA